MYKDYWERVAQNTPTGILESDMEVMRERYGPSHLYAIAGAKELEARRAMQALKEEEEMLYGALPITEGEEDA